MPPGLLRCGGGGAGACVRLSRKRQRRPLKLMPKLPNYDASNRECAAVILADVAKHGGEGSGLVQWARLFLENHPTKSEREESKSILQRSLPFERAA